MTLIDSRPAIMAAWAALSAETGVAIDLAAVDTRMGVKLEDEVGYWFPAARHEEAVVAYRRHYVLLAGRLTTLMPGAAEAIATVRQAGERAVIVTAKHPVSVGPSLAAVDLSADEIFSHVHGAEKAAVLAQIGAVAYVGDTPADMAAAAQAGVTAVGVPTGSFAAAALSAAGANVLLGTLAEFPSWYAGFRHSPAG
jgi:phosphoglycolate phosphatase